MSDMAKIRDIICVKEDSPFRSSQSMEKNGDNFTTPFSKSATKGKQKAPYLISFALTQVLL